MPLTKFLSATLLLLFIVAGTLIGDRTRADDSAWRSKVSHDLRERIDAGDASTLSVIVQPAGLSSDLDAALADGGGKNLNKLERTSFRVLQLPLQAVSRMAARADVLYISPNREAIQLSHVTETTGADLARAVNGTNAVGLDGTGIGIAVLDSGIDTTHTAFLDRSNNLRVVASVDFTGEDRTDDPYGHGTVVTSIAAGNGKVSRAAYMGLAPNANIINLRVLNSQGKGTAAGVLLAIDWVLSNRAAYNIRVVNLSLGLPAIDSYRHDPVCRAVRRLVDAGIVCVAAAGNNGKDNSGSKLYGQIHSPGIEPSALTVGATNTFGTGARNDDEVASYSSRGPTRGRWTDADGVSHYDNIIKPDICAPGNKVIFAQTNLLQQMRVKTQRILLEVARPKLPIQECERKWSGEE